MKLSDDDLSLVSAYLDGELDPETALGVRDRLDREPDLQEALAGFRELSEALSALRPAPPDKQLLKNATSGKWKTLVAASLVCLLFLGSLIVAGRMQPPETTLEWHQHFLSQNYINEEKLKPVAITKWIGPDPDLSAANLTLVDVGQDNEGDVFLHYAGLNGCRLTFGTHAKQPKLPRASLDILSAGWSTGELQYSLLAIGMDGARFRALTELLKEKTRRDDPDTRLFAMVREKTQQATPCA